MWLVAGCILLLNIVFFYCSIVYWRIVQRRPDDCVFVVVQWLRELDGCRCLDCGSFRVKKL